MALLSWPMWILLFGCVFASEGSFVVKVTQTSYQAEENHNITLEWTFTVETGRSSKYLNIYCELIKAQSISILYHVRDGVEVSESQDEKFSGRVQSDKDALREGRIRLQLCRLRTEDSGRYRCEVNTDYGFSSASCRLNVTDPDEVIDAKQGEDITLECWEFTDAPIELLEWSRPELKPDYVFYYREQRSYEIFQHSSYKGRVKLRDPEMKNGDVSVILKEVTFNDAGRYECLVGTRRTRDKRSSISVRVEQTTKDTSGGGNTERENRDVGGNMEREKWRVPQIAAIVITVIVATLILLIGVVVAKVGQQVP